LCSRDSRACRTLSARAARTVIEMNYYPTRFPQRPNVYADVHPREPRLDLPFPALFEIEYEDLVPFLQDNILLPPRAR